MSQTILLGGSGFLGPIILEKYPEIVSVGRTPPPGYIKNRHVPVTLENLGALDALDFDKVIFLVGNSNHHRINKSATMGFDYNVVPLKKALAYFARRGGVKKVISFSTVLLYDVLKLKNPVGESQPVNPYINEYVFSKHMGEEVARFHMEKVPSIMVRFSNIYGPTKLIRPDLVPVMIQKALSPDPSPTYWNAKPVRDFLYLDDAAEAIVKLLDTDYTGPANIGSGVSTSIGEVVGIVEKLSGKRFTNLEKPVSGPMEFTNDISLVKKLTGWAPKTSVEEGIRLSYERMKNWAAECRWWEQEDFKGL